MDYGAANEPPGRAARGLLTWAIDLWPYVNGKALSMNLDLKEMDASDMCDVLHYFFEEDNRFSSGEEAEALSKMRSNLYLLYGKTYKYSIQASSGSTGGRQYINDDFSNIDDPMGEAKSHKGYVPPTKFKGESHAPFGATLDPPIGG